MQQSTAESTGLQKPDLMTVREVAQELRVGESTAYRYISQGEIPAVRIGGTIRVRREVLEEYPERASMASKT